MSWTKRQFVMQAFGAAGISDEFQLQPEQLIGALRDMDAMLGAWAGAGIHVGYPIPTTPENSSLDQETTVPDYANEAVYRGLRLRLTGFGRAITAEDRTLAKDAFNVVLMRSVQPETVDRTDFLPTGAGNRRY